MIYKAYSQDSNYLLSLPETGMGYQIIKGRLSGCLSTKEYVVYNGDLIVDIDNNLQRFKQHIIINGYSKTLNESQLLNIKTESITLVLRNNFYEKRYLTENKKSKKKRHSGGKGATDNPKENADGTEIFVRISAYEDDKRIDFTTNRLKDGTFTTTRFDYLNCVATSDDPIDRYALPNDEKITWAFYIQPKSIDRLQRGIVQPAFGHDGGGIEAYFENGTSKNTFYKKKQYGT